MVIYIFFPYITHNFIIYYYEFTCYCATSLSLTPFFGYFIPLLTYPNFYSSLSLFFSFSFFTFTSKSYFIFIIYLLYPYFLTFIYYIFNYFISNIHIFFINILWIFSHKGCFSTGNLILLNHL